MVLAEPAYAALVEFHSIHKYMNMAHYPQSYELLGQIVAKGSNTIPTFQLWAAQPEATS